VNILLGIFSNNQDSLRPTYSAVDASTGADPSEKSRVLRINEVAQISFDKVSALPDARITTQELEAGKLLSEYSDGVHGFGSKDSPRFFRQFWEISDLNKDWQFLQTTVSTTNHWDGLSQIVYWQNGTGILAELGKQGLAIPAGKMAWGKSGVAVSQMGALPVSLYSGQIFDKNVAVICPKNEEWLPAIWEYCSSNEFNDEVRKIDQALKVTNRTLVKVPFDLSYWQNVANSRIPSGLPKPFSNDPTQWIFHGHPQPATDPLQVAVARLLGYIWPAESDDKMELSDEARGWVSRSKTLASHADKDGIVCIPPVGREASASDRLLNLLADAYGADWSNDVLAQLLTAADHAGKSLETWLRDKFFTQHCALFGNRPFVWQIWDGLRDGFSALVNYHKLDYKTLEALIYTYLGDWISRQKRDAESGIDGAQEKLAAAEALKKRLELILAGEAPYDIFVRWKPIEQQPIGWNPDLNDGVRLNIRPFLSVPDVGKKGAGGLRDKPKSLHWEKDRGSDVPSAPWYELGLQYDGKVGDRINDHHLSLEEKQKAREKAK